MKKLLPIRKVLEALKHENLPLKRRKKPSEKLVRALEDRLYAKLPADYREFLSNFGGVSVHMAKFKFPKKNPYGKFLSVNELYGFASGFDDILNHNMDYSGRIPDEFFAIGSDAGGNQIIIGLEKKVKGQVWLWDHEFEGKKDNIYFMADSFMEFLKGLKPDPDYAE